MSKEAVHFPLWFGLCTAVPCLRASLFFFISHIRGWRRRRTRRLLVPFSAYLSLVSFARGLEREREGGGRWMFTASSGQPSDSRVVNSSVLIGSWWCLDVCDFIFFPTKVVILCLFSWFMSAALVWFLWCYAVHFRWILVGVSGCFYVDGKGCSFVFLNCSFLFSVLATCKSFKNEGTLIDESQCVCSWVFLKVVLEFITLVLSVFFYLVGAVVDKM